MSITETEPNNSIYIGDQNRVAPVEELIGGIAEVNKGVPIPEPSPDIQVALDRRYADEFYSEPAVQVGEIENADELLGLFADKVYGVQLYFAYDHEKDCLVPTYPEVETVASSPENALEITRVHFAKVASSFSEVEIAKMAKLLLPNAHKILADYSQFRGNFEPPTPYSLVDAVIKSDDIELEDDGHDLMYEQTDPLPSLVIELRGGAFQNSPGAIKSHVDGKDLIPPGTVTYVGSVTDDTDRPMDTIITPGVFPRTTVTAQPYVDQLGIKNTTTKTGYISRVSSLTESFHSEPTLDDNPGPLCRVFVRAEVS